MDYRKTAQEILSATGGKDNLASAAHCATRLRLVIADNAKVNKPVLEGIDGVKGVFEASGQLQIIIGTGAVNKVFDEFIAEAGIEAASKEDVKAAAAAKSPWYKRAIKSLGDIFVPIIRTAVQSNNIFPDYVSYILLLSFLYPHTIVYFFRCCLFQNRFGQLLTFCQ